MRSEGEREGREKRDEGRREGRGDEGRETGDEGRERRDEGREREELTSASLSGISYASVSSSYIEYCLTTWSTDC